MTNLAPQCSNDSESRGVHNRPLISSVLRLQRGTQPTQALYRCQREKECYQPPLRTSPEGGSPNIYHAWPATFFKSMHMVLQACRHTCVIQAPSEPTHSPETAATAL